MHIESVSALAGWDSNDVSLRRCVLQVSSQCVIPGQCLKEAALATTSVDDWIFVILMLF